MRKTHGTVDNAVQAEFQDQEVYMDEFSHDITCYNLTCTKCVVIFDKGSIEKEFVIVMLVRKDGWNWKVEQFKHDKTGHYDAIDAMNDGNAWLNYE